MLQRAIVLAVAAAFIGAGQSLIQGPMVFVVGAPGAGKTTQAQALSKTYKLPVIDSADLIKSNPDVFAKIRESKISGMEPQTDPVLNKLFDARLQKGDVGNGVIVSGYPATKDHGDYVQKLVQKGTIPTPTIIQLDVPDEDVRKRLAKSPEYTAEKLEQLLKDYHREFDMLKSYFPNAEVYTIDGSLKIKDVTKKIRAVLDNKIQRK